MASRRKYWDYAHQVEFKSERSENKRVIIKEMSDNKRLQTEKPKKPRNTHGVQDYNRML